MATIPEQIKIIRKKANLSQADLGKCIGVTGAAICNYEKGTRPIRARDFDFIKRLFPDERAA